MENQGLSSGVSVILRSCPILENIRRMFLLSVRAPGTMSSNFMEIKVSAEYILKYFLYFSQKIRFDIWCKLSL